MQTESQTFSLGAILSVMTGTLLCDISDLYRILNFLTGESLYTHQLPRAFTVVSPVLAKRFPDLAHIDTSKVTRSNYRLWLKTMERTYGGARRVTPLPAGAYQSQDPIDELIEMRGGDASGIIVVKT